MATSKQPTWTVNDGIQATAMAIRETLMDYYKGTCVERMTESRVCLQSYHDFERTSSRGRSYYFQRRERDLERKMMLTLGSVPLYVLSDNPQTLLAYLPILYRSPQLKAVHEVVSGFMADYLSGVTMANHTTRKPTNLGIEWKTDVTDDSELVQSSRPRMEPVARSTEETINDYIENVMRVRTSAMQSANDMYQYYYNATTSSFGTSSMTSITNVEGTASGTIEPRQPWNTQVYFNEYSPAIEDMPF